MVVFLMRAAFGNGPIGGCARDREEPIVGLLRGGGRKPAIGLASAERGRDMDAAPQAAARREGGSAEAITTRIGAAALPLGVILIAISGVFHPSTEAPMDFPAVFREYARSDVWTTVHLGEYFGFLLLLGGLVALYYPVRARPGVGRGWRPSTSSQRWRPRPPSRFSRPSTAYPSGTRWTLG
jgi:hypothetical protein